LAAPRNQKSTFFNRGTIGGRFFIKKLQKGENLSLPQSRPMPIVGKRCHEIRIKDENRTWRIIYRNDNDAIILLEIFNKKTQQTPKYIIEICKKRIKDYELIN
jgi:phage-related protein